MVDVPHDIATQEEWEAWLAANASSLSLDNPGDRAELARKLDEVARRAAVEPDYIRITKHARSLLHPEEGPGLYKGARLLNDSDNRMAVLPAETMYRADGGGIVTCSSTNGPIMEDECLRSYLDASASIRAPAGPLSACRNCAEGHSRRTAVAQAYLHDATTH
mgnify:FL=1